GTTARESPNVPPALPTQKQPATDRSSRPSANDDCTTLHAPRSNPADTPPPKRVCNTQRVRAGVLIQINIPAIKLRWVFADDLAQGGVVVPRPVVIEPGPVVLAAGELIRGWSTVDPR